VEVLATGAGRVGVTFFDPAAGAGETFEAAFFGMVALVPLAATGAFAGAAALRTVEAFTDAGLRTAADFRATAAFRAAATLRTAAAGFFPVVVTGLRAAEVCFATTRFRPPVDAALRVVAFRRVVGRVLALRAAAAAFFRAGVCFAGAFFLAAAPDARAGVRRAAAREAGRADLADLRRADVPDLRGAGFLAISGGSFGLP